MPAASVRWIKKKKALAGNTAPLLPPTPADSFCLIPLLSLLALLLNPPSLSVSTCFSNILISGEPSIERRREKKLN